MAFMLGLQGFGCLEVKSEESRETVRGGAPSLVVLHSKAAAGCRCPHVQWAVLENLPVPLEPRAGEAPGLEKLGARENVRAE